MTSVRSLLVLAAACVLGTVASSQCTLRTVEQVTELEFWGPELVSLQLRQSTLNHGAPAPGQTFISPSIGYSFCWPQGGTDLPLVLFLHGGFPGAFDSYCELMLHVASHGYGVLFVNKMSTATTIEEYAADARAVLRHVVSGGDPAIPIPTIGAPGRGVEWTAAGHSWGGAGALFFADDPRFRRIVAMEPVEGGLAFGNRSLTAIPAHIIPDYTGDLFIVTGELDYVTPAPIGEYWYGLAASARRRAVFEIQDIGHYGPMSLTLNIGGTDPLIPTMALPDQVDFPTQLRVHKRILLGCLESGPRTNDGADYHLFGSSMTRQIDRNLRPFEVRVRTEFDRPLAWAKYGEGTLDMGIAAHPFADTQLEWRMSTYQPWRTLPGWPLQLDVSGRHETGIRIPPALLDRIEVRGVVTRDGATTTTRILRP